MEYRKITDASNHSYIETSLSDYALISNPLLNKGMAFTEEERREFNLFGLIPPYTADLLNQLNRTYEAFLNEKGDLEKYIFLRALQDRNETLFYKLLTTHITEMLPIVYTPTVGEGCQRFSHIYRHSRGIFIAYPYRDDIDQILSNSRFDEVRAIVVSDGERILGLGDQGAGGMGIPIGKLSLYSACAGIHPGATLPIILDVGTNNPALINDPLYIGWRHERIRGQDYDDFIEQFVQAVKKRFPHVLLQWEDFAQQNATPILERYRNTLCTFNDDIQGTAAVATGALISAVQISNTQLGDQKIVIVGAGSAGCGIANLMLQAMVDEGLSEREARSRFYLIDRNGLLVEGMQGLFPFQEKFVQSRAALSQWKCSHSDNITLKEVINNLHPSVLVGVSGQPGIFNEEIVREMAKHVQHPIIFPLSNPTSRSEAKPLDLMVWTNGQVIMGTGSPYDPIVKEGQPFRVDQTNNSYIFPGVGLGVIAAKSKYVTDKMFMAAAKALAKCSPAKLNKQANLLPPLTQIRDVSFEVALAVAEEAVASGLAETEEKDLKKLITDHMWVPEYLPYKKLK